MKYRLSHSGRLNVGIFCLKKKKNIQVMNASEFSDYMEIRDLTVQGLEEQPGKWHFYLSKPLG